MGINYKVTLVWAQNVMGVSETLYTPSVDTDTGVFLVNELLQARIQCMFDNQLIQGVRIAQWQTKRRSVMIIPPGGYFPGTKTAVTVPTRGFLKADVSAPTPAQLRDVLQFRCTYGSDRSVMRYLSGVPAQDIGPEPGTFLFQNSGAWLAGWNAYQGVITNRGWAVQGRDRSSAAGPYQVVGITQQTASPGLIGIILRSSLAPTFNMGDKIYTQGFRPKKGTRAPTLNGHWYLSSVDTTSQPGFTILYLRNSQGIDPNQQNFTDKTAVYTNAYVLYSISAIQPVRIGIHKRGRPFSCPRGRSLSRPSLDP